MEFSINKTKKKNRESFASVNNERQFITESEVRMYYDETSFTPKKRGQREQLSMGEHSNMYSKCFSRCGNRCLSFPCGCILFLLGLGLASCYLWVPDEQVKKIVSRVVVSFSLSFSTALH